MSIEQTFTKEQILFLFNDFFGLMKSDFNYDLGLKKRRALFAKAFKAGNFDALLQRSDNPQSEACKESRDMGFRWFRKAEFEGEERHLRIGSLMTNDVVLSDLIFASEQEAIEAIESREWDYGPEDMEDAILVKVNHKIIGQPFENYEDEEADLEPIHYPASVDDPYTSIPGAMLEEKQEEKQLTAPELCDMVVKKCNLSLKASGQVTVKHIDDNFCDIAVSFNHTPYHSTEAEISIQIGKDSLELLPVRLFGSKENRREPMNSHNRLTQGEDFHVKIDPVLCNRENSFNDFATLYHKAGGESKTLVPSSTIGIIFVDLVNILKSLKLNIPELKQVK